jgi:EAL domain-containing protein (putative c-di-GMP-specific phosphodiesterase class I)
MLLDCTLDEGKAIAEKLVARIAELRFPWEDKIYDVSASLGMVPVDCFSPRPEMIVSQADVAAFTSKRNGRNQVSIYLDEEQAAGDLQEMAFVADLRRAIEADQFELYAQPIVLSHDTARFTYFEILLRMRNERGELVSPAFFIPAAERYGLMTLVDRWVVRTALQMHAKYKREDHELRFAINLSADSLSDRELWSFVQEQFRLSGVEPANITFEVTETGLIQSFANAREFMRQARQAGAQIALDDFGTGLSSLSYLKQFPMDVLKIDGSFVRQLTSNTLDQSIVSAIAQIARSMNAVTVAESVEDHATIDMLRDVEVDYLQGWATGRPAPLHVILAAPVAPAAQVSMPVEAPSLLGGAALMV